MSVEAVRWAWTQTVSPAAAKLVLCALAWKADRDGYAWPAQTTLAEMAGVDIRSVRRHIAALEKAGLIARTEGARRSDGTFGGSSYRLQLSTASGHQRPMDQRTPVSATSGHPWPPIDKDNLKDKQSRRISWDTPVDNGQPLSDDEKAEYQARLRGLREQRFR